VGYFAGIDVSSLMFAVDGYGRTRAPAPGGGLREAAYGRGRGQWTSVIKLVWGCLCQALVIAAPPWLKARPRGLASAGCVTIGGELAIAGRGSSRRELVCGRPAWGRTMMQPCASAAKLRGDGPIL
jgi:hypothetical protein